MGSNPSRKGAPSTALPRVVSAFPDFIRIPSRRAASSRTFSRVFWWLLRNDGRTDCGEICSSRELRCAWPEAHTRTGAWKVSLFFLTEGPERGSRDGAAAVGTVPFGFCRWKLGDQGSARFLSPAELRETQACGRKRRRSPRPVSEINVSAFASPPLPASCLLSPPSSRRRRWVLYVPEASPWRRSRPGGFRPTQEGGLKSRRGKALPTPRCSGIPGIAPLNLQCTLRIPPSPQGTRWPRRRRTPS